MPNMVTVAEAKEQWEEMIASTARGEEWLIIDDEHHPVAYLTPPAPVKVPAADPAFVRDGSPRGAKLSGK